MLVMVVSAINSVGFYHFDEHFQVIEFARFLSGDIGSENLSWEFHEKARSAFMPYAAYYIIDILNSNVSESPFIQVIFIRLFIGIFMLLVMFYFTESIKNKLKEESHLILYFLSYFLYFIPYFFVRFSSETVSTGFFLLGLTLVIRVTDRPKELLLWFVAGLCIGLAFLCRFQSAFLSAGLVTWLVFIHKIDNKQLVIFICGGLLVLGLGLLIDYCLYDQLVFTPYHYFRVNILEARSEYWGKSNFFYYFNLLFRMGIMDFLNFTLLISLIVYLRFNLKSILTFCILPFILIHFMVSHKELRFLFPIFIFIPFITTFSLTKVKSYIRNALLLKSLMLVLSIFGLLNFMALILNALKPADGQPLVYEYFYRTHKTDSIQIYYLEEKWNFMECQASLEMSFYKNPKHKIQAINPSGIYTLPVGSFILTNGNTKMENFKLTKIHNVMPKWLVGLNQLHLFSIKNCNWVIYQTNLNNNPHN